MFGEETESKIQDGLDSIFCHGGWFLGMDALDWEELALDALVESISGDDIAYILRGVPVSLKLREDVRKQLTKKCYKILSDAYNDELEDWGFEELIVED